MTKCTSVTTLAELVVAVPAQDPLSFYRANQTLGLTSFFVQPST